MRCQRRSDAKRSLPYLRSNSLRSYEVLEWNADEMLYCSGVWSEEAGFKATERQSKTDTKRKTLGGRERYGWRTDLE